MGFDVDPLEPQIRVDIGGTLSGRYRAIDEATSVNDNTVSEISLVRDAGEVVLGFAFRSNNPVFFVGAPQPATFTRLDLSTRNPYTEITPPDAWSPRNAAGEYLSEAVAQVYVANSERLPYVDVPDAFPDNGNDPDAYPVRANSSTARATTRRSAATDRSASGIPTGPTRSTPSSTTPTRRTRSPRCGSSTCSMCWRSVPSTRRCATGCSTTVSIIR